MQQNSLEKRLWFVELIVWWEGKINASMLISQFAISRVQAQQDIKRYQQQAPDNLIYCASCSAPPSVINLFHANDKFIILMKQNSMAKKAL